MEHMHGAAGNQGGVRRAAGGADAPLPMLRSGGRAALAGLLLACQVVLGGAFLPAGALLPRIGGGRSGACTFRMAALGADDTPCDQEGAELMSRFTTTVLRNSQSASNLQHRLPSALLPPHTAVQIQLEALQMNDFPEVDGGCRHAYRFAVRGNNFLFGSVGKPFILQKGKSDPSRVEDRIYMDPSIEDRHLAKDWRSDQLLDEAGFVSMVRRDFAHLIGAPSFAWASAPEFGVLGDSCRVRVRVGASEGGEAVYMFEQVRVADGAYKDCWMTGSVRRI